MSLNTARKACTRTYRHVVLSAAHERTKSTLHLLDLGRLLISMKMFSVTNQRPAHKLKCVPVHRFKSVIYRSLRTKDLTIKQPTKTLLEVAKRPEMKT